MENSLWKRWTCRKLVRDDDDDDDDDDCDDNNNHKAVLAECFVVSPQI